MRRTRSAIARVRNWERRDIPGLVACQKAAYPDLPPELHFDASMHEKELEAFPEGQFLAEADGRVVGYATAVVIRFDDGLRFRTWEEITGGGTFHTHVPDGDTLYGADIAVDVEYRGRGIASLLYGARKRLLERRRLTRVVSYGRIPGYRSHARDMTPWEYVRRVRDGRLSDPALSMHLKVGYRIVDVLLDSVRDPPSLDCCTLLEMPNPALVEGACRDGGSPCGARR